MEDVRLSWERVLMIGKRWQRHPLPLSSAALIRPFTPPQLASSLIYNHHHHDFDLMNPGALNQNIWVLMFWLCSSVILVIPKQFDHNHYLHWDYICVLCMRKLWWWHVIQGWFWWWKSKGQSCKWLCGPIIEQMKMLLPFNILRCDEIWLIFFV